MSLKLKEDLNGFLSYYGSWDSVKYGSVLSSEIRLFLNLSRSYINNSFGGAPHSIINARAHMVLACHKDNICAIAVPY